MKPNFNLMAHRSNKQLRTTVFLCAMIILNSNAFALGIDWTDYDVFLTRNTSTNVIDGVTFTAVDYSKIKKNSKELDELVQQIVRVDTQKLATQAEKIAFYINAYNIYTLKIVVDHFPIKSIKDIGNIFFPVWKKKVGVLDGEKISLHHIEHEILRPMGDPRIHMAIVCASVSCPDLRAEAYTIDRLDFQLEDQSRIFLQNTEKGLNFTTNKLVVSKIFKWFEDDFAALGGVKQFIDRYSSTQTDNLIVDYLPYNWQLNGL